jgi:hypothetical protein
VPKRAIISENTATMDLFASEQRMDALIEGSRQLLFNWLKKPEKFEQ